MNNEKINLKIKKVDLETALNFSNKSNLTTFLPIQTSLTILDLK